MVRPGGWGLVNNNGTHDVFVGENEGYRDILDFGDLFAGLISLYCSVSKRHTGMQRVQNKKKHCFFSFYNFLVCLIPSDGNSTHES